MQDVVLGALIAWAAAVAVMDWRQRKVSNALLLALLLPAVGLLLLRGSGPLSVHWLLSLVGMAVGFAVTLPGYLVSKLGAGDVKLAAVMGLVVGWPLAAWVLLASGLLLGAMSLAVVMLAGLGNARALRLPAAVAFSGGFGAVLLAQRGGWL